MFTKLAARQATIYMAFAGKLVWDTPPPPPPPPRRRGKIFRTAEYDLYDYIRPEMAEQQHVSTNCHEHFVHA